MPRVKGGPRERRRHKKVLKQTKGHHGVRHRLYRRASESRLHALSYAYAHRRERKKATCAASGSSGSTPPPDSTAPPTAVSSTRSSKPGSRSIARSSPRWPCTIQTGSAPSSNRPTPADRPPKPRHNDARHRSAVSGVSLVFGRSYLRTGSTALESRWPRTPGRPHRLRADS